MKQRVIDKKQRGTESRNTSRAFVRFWVVDFWNEKLDISSFFLIPKNK